MYSLAVSPHRKTGPSVLPLHVSNNVDSDPLRKCTCNVQFSLLFRNSTKRSTTPEVAMTSSMGGLGSK